MVLVVVLLSVRRSKISQLVMVMHVDDKKKQYLSQVVEQRPVYVC